MKKIKIKIKSNKESKVKNITSKIIIKLKLKKVNKKILKIFIYSF